MYSTYYLSVAIHVLAAMVWLGGMFFLALVGAPVLRAVEDAALRQRMFDTLGYRFRAVGWMALGVLFVTGLFNLHFRGALKLSLWTDAAWLQTPWSRALQIKLAAFVVMLFVEGYHDFVLGPKAGRVPPGSAEALALRKQASLFARVSAIAGLIIVFAAVKVARG